MINSKTSLLTLIAFGVAIACRAETDVPNDGFIELPVADEQMQRFKQRLSEWKVDPGKPFGNEGDGVFGIGAHMAGKFYGRSQTMEIDGNGGESPTAYTITYTDSGYLDDAIQAKRYQLVIGKTPEHGLVLKSARAWIQPWPERYESLLRYFKEKKIEWIWRDYGID